MRTGRDCVGEGQMFFGLRAARRDCQTDPLTHSSSFLSPFSTLNFYYPIMIMKTTLLIAFIVTVYAVPLPLMRELQSQFSNYDGNNPLELVQMSRTLNLISKLAQQKVYGRIANDAASKFNLTVSGSVTEPGVSFAVATYLFEGDILLTPRQTTNLLHSILDQLRRRSKRFSGHGRIMSSLLEGRIRRKRKMFRPNAARWTEFPILYRIHESLEEDAVENVHLAVNFWQDNTCLSFQEVEEAPSGDYIEFFKGLGCYSMIGRVGGRQGISVGTGCERMGIIAHELGHSLGFWHEQSRPDADSSIKIVPANIINQMISNFLQRTYQDVITYDIPYDLGSVMHYGSTAFTNDWSKETILTLIPAYQRVIGQRERPSFYDVEIINKAYCTDTCAVSLPCEHGGVTNSANCSHCMCPDGLGGQFCEKAEDPINGDCGTTLTMGLGDSLEIQSPGYPNPGYQTEQKCAWFFKTEDEYRFQVEFLDNFQLFCTTTCIDYVEVKNGTDLANTGMRFCCFDKPEPLLSDGNRLIVIFRSVISRDVGFKARVRVVSGELNLPPKIEPLTTSPPPTTTTTTQATTTTTEEKEITTTEPEYEEPTSEDNGWEQWSEWTLCTKTCGACGIRLRIRKCKDYSCRGKAQEFKRCGFTVCPGETACTRLHQKDQLCGEKGDRICSDSVESTFKCQSVSCCPPFQPLREKCRLYRGARKK